MSLRPLLVALVVPLGCEPAPSPRPMPSASISAVASATVSAPAPARVPRAHPAMGQPPQPRPPAKPVGDATLAEHIMGDARIHIWEVGQRGADAGPRLGATLVTDADLIARIKKAIGFAQKPKPPKEPCKPCKSPARFVFQSQLGMDLGGVDIGCEGDPKGTGRYWQPASSKCGFIQFAQPSAIAKLIAEAKQKKPAKYPGQSRLP